MTRYASYLNTRVAIAEIEEQDAEANLNKVQAIKLLENKPTRSADSVTIAKAHRDIDEEVVELAEAYRHKHAYRKLVQTIYENCVSEAALVSRELSRRIGRNERNERRADRLGA